MSVFKFIREDGRVLELDRPWGIIRSTLEGLDWPDVDQETEPYAFKDGSYWTKNQAVKRVIAFEAVCREHDENFILRDMIGTFFNFSVLYELYINIDGKEAYSKGKITDFELPPGKENSIVRFSLEFTSTNPFLQSSSDFGRNLNEVYAKIHYPRHYLIDEKKPYSVRAFAAQVNIVNTGVVETGFVATVLFAEDTSSFTLKNGAGQKLEITRSFTAGDLLQIDTSDGVARLNGTKFYKGISAESEFFLLSPGVNALSYNAAAGESTMDINIYFRSQRVVF